MKKIFIFLLNPGLLIPVLCICTVLYYSGIFPIFKTYEEHTVNVCIRTVDLNNNIMNKDIKTDDNKFRWYVVCGLLVNEIENDNQPGVLTNGQEDVSAGLTTTIKCLIDGPGTYTENTKLGKIANFDGKCTIKKITEWNNGQKIYEINNGLVTS